jgi:hypothetical protein
LPLTDFVIIYEQVQSEEALMFKQVLRRLGLLCLLLIAFLFALRGLGQKNNPVSFLSNISSTQFEQAYLIEKAP